MAITLNLSTHRRWEDWVQVGLGILLIISPWLVQQGTGSQSVILNCVVVGLAVGCLAGLELAVLGTWEEWLEGALGLWMIAAPWALGYNAEFGVLTATHVALGGVIVVLAGLELWQDTGRRAARL